MTAFTFWGSVAGILYIGLGYPALIWLCARLRPRPVSKGEMRAPVSVILIAHNEAGVLERKIDDLLSSSCEPWIVEILVVSDGSTDETDVVMDRLAGPKVAYMRFEQHRGKAAALHDAIGRATGDITVFVDARQRLDADAIERLLENFADTTVGVVSGALEYDEPDSVGGDGAGSRGYWAFERWLREAESRYWSVPGATGALYAVRSDCLTAPPPDVVLDDVVIPMQAVVSGYRCIVEPTARVRDRVGDDERREYARKRRTLAGCVQLVRRYPRWMIPGENPIWWQYTSHKVLRLFTPFLILAAFISACFLDQPLYRITVIVFVVFVGLGCLGMLARRIGFAARWLQAPVLFVTFNGVILLGLLDGIRGRYDSAWRE